MMLASVRWGCPYVAGSSIHLEVENDCMVEKSGIPENGAGPLQCSEVEATKVGFYKRGVQWDTPMGSMGG